MTRTETSSCQRVARSRYQLYKSQNESTNSRKFSPNKPIEHTPIANKFSRTSKVKSQLIYWSYTNLQTHEQSPFKIQPVLNVDTRCTPTNFAV